MASVGQGMRGLGSCQEYDAERLLSWPLLLFEKPCPVDCFCNCVKSCFAPGNAQGGSLEPAKWIFPTKIVVGHNCLATEDFMKQ